MSADRSATFTPSCSSMPSDRHDLVPSNKATTAIDEMKKINDDQKQLREQCNKLPHLDGRFFEVDYARSSLRGMIVAKCKLCDSCKEPISGFLGGRWHFEMHIQARHASRFKAFLEYVGEEVARSSKTLVHSNLSQKTYEENVKRFIRDSKLPLSIVESPSFRRLIDDLAVQNCIKLQHLSKEELDKQQSTITYNKQTQLLREKLSEVNRACTTADIWMNDTERFLCVTVQWIDPETFKRNSAAIACRRVRQLRSADLLGKMIDEIHASFKLNASKIMVTDSGCCFAEAYRDLQIRVPSGCFSEDEVKDFLHENSDGSSLESDETSTGPMDQQHDRESSMVPGFIPDLRSDSTLWQHFRCICRSMNLIATTDVSTALQSSDVLRSLHEDAVDRCDRMCKMLAKPEIRQHLTKDWGKAFVDSISEKPSSVFRLFDQVLKLNPKLTATCAFLGIEAPLRICDFSYIEEYSKCLRIVASTIEELQGATDSTFGYVLPTLVSLRKQLTQLSEKHEFLYCRSLMDALIRSVDTRFADYFNVEGVGEFAAIAAIVHPKFKIWWINHLNAKAQYPAYSAAALAAKSVPTSSSQSDADTEKQLKRYYAAPCTDDVFSLSNYPVIKQMFLHFNAPLAGSTPVERLFSQATMRNAPRLSNLSDEDFERRMLSTCNERVWRQNFVL